ncbi:hypothetical protein [Nocardioides aurantiacus]|uniref:Uncharacterized protein n=1 Tax=Nocardioides aurantiacus TaxID=86796 RepID=A0A3N2CWY6_9ACTN|nr:hypothetical protein [Nocardioides aurantiacus]ROR91724.1 hypothetical protein EDD33_2599 [Nocardioides aurantiacus]
MTPDHLVGAALVLLSLAVLLVIYGPRFAAWVGGRKDDLARDRQARDDKAVRTWMDRGAA